jgi:hypothetical protein
MKFYEKNSEFLGGIEFYDPEGVLLNSCGNIEEGVLTYEATIDSETLTSITVMF